MNAAFVDGVAQSVGGFKRYPPDPKAVQSPTERQTTLNHSFRIAATIAFRLNGNKPTGEWGVYRRPLGTHAEWQNVWYSSDHICNFVRNEHYDVIGDADGHDGVPKASWGNSGPGRRDWYAEIPVGAVLGPVEPDEPDKPEPEPDDILTGVVEILTILRRVFK